jgi:hypothetical protein
VRPGAALRRRPGLLAQVAPALAGLLAASCSFRGEGLSVRPGAAPEPFAGTPGEPSLPIGESRLDAAPAGEDPPPDAAAEVVSADASISGDAGASDVTPAIDGLPADALPADASVPQDPLARGILLYLPFEPAGSALDDRSPLHQVAVPHQIDPAAALVDGHSGAALGFAGSAAGGYLSVDGWALNRIGAALTVSCWYRSSPLAPAAGTILAREWRTVKGSLYRFAISGGKLELLIDAGNVYHGKVTSRADVPAGRWVHLAATFDGLRATLFIDGISAGSAAYRMGVPDEQTPLLVGANASSSGVSDFLSGELDDVILYDRALDAAEVTALARGGQPSLY